MGALRAGQQIAVDEAPVDRREGQGLEAEHRAFAARDRRGGGDELEVLDANAVVAFLVVAGLVGDDHPRLQGDGVRLLGDAVRTFVDAEINADAVAGAVVVIETSHPHRQAREGVEGRSGGADREAYGGEGEVAFQDQGEALAPSRPPMGFAMLREPLRLVHPLGAFNGGTLIEADGRVIEEVLVPAEAARIALATFAAMGVDAWLFTRDTWYAADPEGAYVPKERHTIQAEPAIVASFDSLLDHVGKLVGSTRDPDLLARCESVLQERLGETASARRSQAYYLDVTPHVATKGYAVKRIADVLGISLAETAVIGDAANDLPMFAVAGLAIAMGNGIADVKAKAHFTTASNAEDGFAVAMEHYVLPRAEKRSS